MLTIGLYINQNVASGGGFHEAINSVQNFTDVGGKFEVQIFTSIKQNIKVLEELGYKAEFIKLSIARRFILFIRYQVLSVTHKITPGNVTPTRLLKKILAKYNSFEKVFIESGVDLIYFSSPETNAMFVENLNYVVTVWDLAHRVTPEFPELRCDGAFETREYYYSRVLPKAYAVIVGHNYAKKQISYYYQVNPDKVFVIPFKASKFLCDFEDKKESFSQFDKLEGEKYIYYPAQYWAHKNHSYILSALKIYVDMFKENIKLVCTGGDKGNYEYLQALVKKYELSDNVLFLGFQSNEDVYAIFKRSLAMVMPSFIGPAALPTMEAFYLEVPLLMPNLPHYVDFYADSCLYFDINSPETLSVQLNNIVKNKEVRENLIKLGRKKYTEIYAGSEVREMQAHLTNFSMLRGAFE